jgi:hypothetical protein
MFSFISDIFYWIRCHTFTKYHIINCSQPKNSQYKYRWGFIDPCERIMFGLFNEVVKYVEGYIVKLDDSDRTDTDREILSIYQWWTIDHQNDLKDLNYHYEEYGMLTLASDNAKAFKEAKEKLEVINILEQKSNREIEEYLIRIIKVRESMWYP